MIQVWKLRELSDTPAEEYRSSHKVEAVRVSKHGVINLNLINLKFELSFILFSSWWRHQMEIFRVTGPLCEEFTGHRWIPFTKASNAELWCFLWYAHEQIGWVNTRNAGDLRHHRVHYDVTVMSTKAHAIVPLLLPGASQAKILINITDGLMEKT